MTDQQLMESIKTKYGAQIKSSCAASSIPPAFIAALIANESGGDPSAKRFESKVLLALWEVLMGRKEAYGSISRGDLVQFVFGLPSQSVSAPASLPDTYQRLDGLATSQGITQILGTNAMKWMDPRKLADPALALHYTITMLAQFAHRYQLDLATDFPPLFACWNSGGPDPAKTFDPQYVPNGVMRMKLYADLLANDTDPGQ